MKAQAIIPTAGMGTRMGSAIPKTLMAINGVPLIIHTLRVFEQCEAIDAVILVVHQDFAEDYRQAVDKFGITKIKEYITGGQTRCQSVGNGLSYLDDDCDVIVVHDGARPLVTPKLIERAIGMCSVEKAVVVGLPVKQTIKKVSVNEAIVEKTLNREELWEIQTPQVFQKEVLMDAYEQTDNYEATDDASLVERIGIKVKVIEGDYMNVKVTTPEDLIIVQKLLDK